jgi:hypothetical protein
VCRLQHGQPCEIHIFDPTARATDLPADLNGSSIKFHPIGLGARDKLTKLQFVKGDHSQDRFQLHTLDSIMRKLGHSFIDVLKVDIEGNEGPVIAGLRPSQAGAPLAVGQLLIEVHSNRIPGGSRGAGRGRLFERLESQNFHVFYKEVNVLHTSNCEYAWTRVAMRCVRIAPADAPRLVPVSFPWARLLPESCDGYEDIEAARSPLTRLQASGNKAHAPGSPLFLRESTADERPPPTRISIPQERAPTWWAAVKQEDDARAKGEAGDGGVLKFAPFNDAMGVCGQTFLQYAVAHNAITGMKSPKWLSQRHPEKALTLRGVLLVEPQHGGMGNVMRILSQYALLGVLLRRLVCFRLGSELHAMIFPFMRSPLLDWTCPAGIATNATRDEINVSKQGTLSFYAKFFADIDIRHHFANVDVLHIRADSSEVASLLLGNRYLVPRGTPNSATLLPSCIRQLFFQPTQRTLTALTPFLELLHFPQPYAAAHLRMGDKHMEHIKLALHSEQEPGAATRLVTDQRVRPTHKKYTFNCFRGFRDRVNATLFISSDSSDLLPAIKQELGGNVVFVPGTSVHTGNWVTVAHRDSVSITTVESVQKVWVDFLLLSLQRLGIITSGGRLSSFTSEAHARVLYLGRQSPAFYMRRCH